MSDAFPAHGGGGEDASPVRERQETAGGAERRGPLHDAVQPHRETQPAHVHHDLHGELQRQRPDANAGETQTVTDRQAGRDRQVETQTGGDRQTGRDKDR